MFGVCTRVFSLVAFGVAAVYSVVLPDMFERAKDREALVEDCQVADVVISPVPAPKGCRAPVVIDRWRLLSGGAHAILPCGTAPISALA